MIYLIIYEIFVAFCKLSTNVTYHFEKTKIKISIKTADSNLREKKINQKPTYITYYNYYIMFSLQIIFLFCILILIFIIVLWKMEIIIHIYIYVYNVIINT